jgi:hypothetical protein
MPDDEDDENATIHNLADYPEFNPAPPDVAVGYIAFLDNAIRMLQPTDFFSEVKANRDEWFNLYTSDSKDTFAAISVFVETNKDHQEVGTIIHKVGLAMTLLKRRFNNAEAYKEFNKDVGKRIKWLKEAPNEKYTPFIIPRGQWPKVNSKGEPVPHNENAIAALRWYFEEEGVTATYDHWKNSVSITSPKKSKFPRESKDFIVKNYVNQLVGKYEVLFTLEEIKFALGQLAANNARHSMLDYYNGPK